MAVPFYIPDEDEASSRGDASAVSSSPNSPSRPILIPLGNGPQSPQQSPIDNEILVQAFYEALCRCSQGKIQFYSTYKIKNPEMQEFNNNKF